MGRITHHILWEDWMGSSRLRTWHHECLLCQATSRGQVLLNVSESWGVGRSWDGGAALVPRDLCHFSYIQPCLLPPPPTTLSASQTCLLRQPRLFPSVGQCRLTLPGLYLALRNGNKVPQPQQHWRGDHKASSAFCPALSADPFLSSRTFQKQSIRTLLEHKCELGLAHSLSPEPVCVHDDKSWPLWFVFFLNYCDKISIT